MTDLRQAAQMALEAFEYASTGNRRPKITNEALAREHAMRPPEWPLIKNILDEYGLDAISFVAEWKAAQRPWVDLTDGDWEWVADRKGTSLDTFAHGAAWAQQRLKELNK